MGKLYVVPTPIGNLGDITLRAKETLEGVDFVASEDTRIGGRLMHLLGLKKPLVSFHEHTKASACEAVALRIAQGENCALITDAGTPAVSDPGEKLVAACAAMGVDIIPLPGACAAVTALSASGLPSRRFCFEGFLPDTKSARAERIAELKSEKRTFILYISPHDAAEYLNELAAEMGERRCVLAKELTKLHERFFRGTLGSVAQEFSALPEPDRRGEYVLICTGRSDEECFWLDMDIREHVEKYMSLGMSKMDACKQVARDRGVGKGVIYREVNE